MISSIGLAAAAAIIAAADGTVAAALARCFCPVFILADLGSLALVIIKVRAEIVCCGGHAPLTAAGTRRCSAAQSDQSVQQQSNTSGYVCLPGSGLVCCARNSESARLAARCATSRCNSHGGAPRLYAHVKQAGGTCLEHENVLINTLLARKSGAIPR